MYIPALKRSRPDAAFFSIFCTVLLVMMPTATQAELHDRGNGLIYDDVQDLTWTQNASMFYGRWYDVTINNVFIVGAQTWAENLVYGGFDDWRLPTTTQFDDPTCSSDIRSAGDYQLFYEHRADCTGGEMELLTALYNPAYNPIFSNIGNTRYWTATPYRDWEDPCIYYSPIPPHGYDVPCNLPGDNGDRTDFYWQWGFKGFQDSGGEYHNIPFKTTLEGGNSRYAWAVRDGDVIASILPGDVNLDGVVNVSDYLLLTQYVLGTRASPASGSDEFKAADMNENSQLDAGDLVILSRTVMGLI